MEDPHRSVSVNGSSLLTWEIIDKRMNELNLKQTSKYFQYLAEKDIFEEPKKISKTEVFLITLIFLAIAGIGIQIMNMLGI